MTTTRKAPATAAFEVGSTYTATAADGSTVDWTVTKRTVGTITICDARAVGCYGAGHRTKVQRTEAGVEFASPRGFEDNPPVMTAG